MSLTELFVRVADAGDTYVYWRWCGESVPSAFARLRAGQVTEAVAALNRALPAPLRGESSELAVKRALRSGDYAEVSREAELARVLTSAVFPSQLRRSLQERIDAGAAVRVRVTPSPRLARIPWETLILDDGRRLVEAADVVYDPPSTVYVQREREPAASWSDVASLPPLHIVDPALPRRTVRLGGLQQVLDEAGRERLRSLTDRRSPDRVGRVYDRFQFSKDLVEPQKYSRLFYFGHVSASADEPGSACLHLSDTASTWGLATAYRAVRADGTPAAENLLDHRPLSALDLLLGTTTAVDRDRRGWIREGVADRQYGARLWPMPQRVALIACDGGADFRSAETFGLVLAMLNAGAELVTTTRWTLPTDAAFALPADAWCPATRLSESTDSWRPTTRLAEAVDMAHRGDDPVAAIAEWQRDELSDWQKTGNLLHSPLLWASLCHALAPIRP